MAVATLAGALETSRSLINLAQPVRGDVPGPSEKSDATP
jgi:hypothetical protein